jgi:hypothetical protein
MIRINPQYRFIVRDSHLKPALTGKGRNYAGKIQAIERRLDPELLYPLQVLRDLFRGLDGFVQGPTLLVCV